MMALRGSQDDNSASTWLHLHQGSISFLAPHSRLVAVSPDAVRRSQLLQDLADSNSEAAEAEVPITSSDLQLWLSSILGNTTESGSDSRPDPPQADGDAECNVQAADEQCSAAGVADKSGDPHGSLRLNVQDRIGLITVRPHHASAAACWCMHVLRGRGGVQLPDSTAHVCIR